MQLLEDKRASLVGDGEGAKANAVTLLLSLVTSNTLPPDLPEQQLVIALKREHSRQQQALTQPKRPASTSRGAALAPLSDASAQKCITDLLQSNLIVRQSGAESVFHACVPRSGPMVPHPTNSSAFVLAHISVS